MGTGVVRETPAGRGDTGAAFSMARVNASSSADVV